MFKTKININCVVFYSNGNLEDYYYDESYTKNKEWDSLEDYNFDHLDAKQGGLEPSKSHASKEISNYLTRFNKQGTRHRAHITTSGNLILRQVTRADKGSYVCRATNMVGSKSSEAATLSVHGKSWNKLTICICH